MKARIPQHREFIINLPKWIGRNGVRSIPTMVKCMSP